MVPNQWFITTVGKLGTDKKPAVKAGPFGSALKKEFYTQSGYKIYGQEQVISNNPFYGDYYIDEQKFNSLKSCAVSPGDILLSLVGTIGKVLLLPKNCEEGIINPRLLRLSLDSEIVFNLFFKYFLEFDHTAKALHRKAQGGTMGVINAESIKSLPILIPPIEEQKKIAEILSTWDKAIASTEKLIVNSEQQKKALMQQLLTGKKRLLDENSVRFSGEWKKQELGSILKYCQPTEYLVKSTEYNNSYSTPVLTAGKSFLLGYTDESFGIYHNPLPAIIFDDFTTSSHLVNFPFKVKSSAIKILTTNQEYSIKYIFEAMQMIGFTIGGHQRHWISIFSNLTIYTPTLIEQKKIAEVLSNTDREIELLKAKLEHLQQEKKALMQQLLTGKRRVAIN